MLKTNRSVAKRFKKIGKGKIKRGRANKGHILGKKSRKRKRNLKGTALVSSKDMKSLRRMMPYG